MKSSPCKWSSNWPTAPGLYWFYGFPFGNDEHKPEWNLVKVIEILNGVMTVRDGTFWYKNEGWRGMFLKIQLPKPPELSQTEPSRPQVCQGCKWKILSPNHCERGAAPSYAEKLGKCAKYNVEWPAS